MPPCQKFRNEVPSNARFCRNCGSQLLVKLPPRDLRNRHGNGKGWHTMDDILYTRDKCFGAIGALLVLLAAFSPLATTTVPFF